MLLTKGMHKIAGELKHGTIALWSRLLSKVLATQSKLFDKMVSKYSGG